MAIIGVSGHIGSGKDEIGKIIQYITWRTFYKSNIFPEISERHYEEFCNSLLITDSKWQIYKFADTLKDIICILTGCTREQLEDEDFKNSKLPDEWIRYGYADGFSKKYIGNGDMGEPIMNFKECSKERYEHELKVNWQTAYKIHLTYRELLQQLGTDLFRNQLHENVWINSLMSKYKPKICSGVTHCALVGKPEISCNECPEYPNWIITDCRFLNEAKAIKDKGGIIIRVDRPIDLRFPALWKLYPNKELLIEPDEQSFFEWLKEYDIKLYKKLTHESETELDNYKFDYAIDNNSTIEELILRVKEILQIERII